MCGSVLVLSVQDPNLFQDNEDDNDNDNTNPHNMDEKADYLCMFKCGYCQWTSHECGISTPVRLHDGKNQEDDDEMELATKRIQEQLSSRLFAQQEQSQGLFQSLIKGWEKENIQQGREKRQQQLMISPRNKSGKVANSFVDKESRSGGKGQVSSLASIVERIEQSIADKKRTISQKVFQSITHEEEQTWHTLQVRGGAEEKSEMDNDINQTLHNNDPITPAQNIMQSVISSSIVTSQGDMLPIPLSLRAKSIRRCTFELEAGRTGILVKPKVNPLEGDSSLRFGHGQWWKKDSSAIHTIPRVSIHTYGFDQTSGRYALLLKVKNPTISMVRLRLKTMITQPAKAFQQFSNLLLDSISMKTVNATMIPPTEKKGNNQMKYIELEPYEDIFLGFGKGGLSQFPSAVDEWDASKCISSYLIDKEESSQSLCMLVAQDKDSAWIQYIVSQQQQQNVKDQNIFMATPLILDVDIGEGSWESSLIQSEADGEMDHVDLHLLPVWKVMD